MHAFRHMQLHGYVLSIPNRTYWGMVYASYNVGGIIMMNCSTVNPLTGEFIIKAGVHVFKKS